VQGFRYNQAFGRRDFLNAAGALGLAGLAAPALSTVEGVAASPTPTPRNIPIKHVIVDMQENRSFDHYFGFAPWVGSYGVPPGYTQPDGRGGTVAPYHFTGLSTPDIGHSWDATHREWDDGKMDGFFTTDGIDCMG